MGELYFTIHFIMKYTSSDAENIVSELENIFFNNCVFNDVKLKYQKVNGKNATTGLTKKSFSKLKSLAASDQLSFIFIDSPDRNIDISINIWSSNNLPITLTALIKLEYFIQNCNDETILEKIQDNMYSMWNLCQSSMIYGYSSLGRYREHKSLLDILNETKRDKLLYDLKLYFFNLKEKQKYGTLLKNIPIANINAQDAFNISNKINTGEGIKGAYWINLISKPYLDKLGINLFDKDIYKIRKIGNNGIMLIADSSPLGRNSDIQSKRYNDLSELLKPIFIPEENLILYDGKLSRFIGDRLLE